MDFDYEDLWIAIGLAGQALFFCRFFVQWIASERRQESVIPRAFWFFSLGGGLVLLSYAIHRRDPVFILGQSAGVFIYLRNLWFIYGKKSEPPTGPGGAPAPAARPPEPRD